MSVIPPMLKALMRPLECKIENHLCFSRVLSAISLTLIPYLFIFTSIFIFDITSSLRMGKV